MSGSRSISIVDMLFLTGLGLIAFIPFLGASPLFDWDEINFAESAREMMVTGNYFQVQINFEPFWEKPPLFFWLQVLSMKTFGVNEFGARFPNAVVGIFTLLALYYYGTKLQGKVFGRFVSGFYFVSILPHLYFKSGIIDPTFNFFIFLALIHIIKYEIEYATKDRPPVIRMAPWVAGYWAGMATLTKGPVAVLVIFLVYLVFKLFYSRKHFPGLALLKFILVYGVVIMSWFGSIVVFTEDGWGLVNQFISYQVELFSQPVAGHEQPAYYHLLIFTVGCFPMSAFAFRGMRLKPKDFRERMLKRFMLIWFWVVLILFTIVETKIVHYSSLLYYPGAFLAAAYVTTMIEEKWKMKWDNWILYGLGVLIFGIAVGSINILTSNLDWLMEQVDDPFGRANLATEVNWTGWEFLPAAFFTIVLLVNGWYLAKKRYRTFLFIQVLATPLYMNGINAMIVPKVAGYTQLTAIEFFKEKADEDAYLMIEGYKSYAHYFYGQVKPFPYPEIPRSKRGEWLVRGAIDKPVYLITRIDRATEEFENVWFDTFRKIDERNGFVFYIREASQRGPSSKGPA